MLRQLKTTLTYAAGRLRRMHAVRRLVQGEDGVAAIEFALIVAPFLALIFAIIETSLIFFTTQSLERATADAARLIMTGQQQKVVAPGDPIVEFKKRLCYDPPAGSPDQRVILPMIDCTKLTVQVLSADSVGYSSGSTTNSKLGGPGCIVTVQVTYQWPVWVSLYSLSFTLAGGKWDGKHAIKATAVFRNEPYGNPTGC
jgi:TadE-like protein